MIFQGRLQILYNDYSVIYDKSLHYPSQSYQADILTVHCVRCYTNCMNKQECIPVGFVLQWPSLLPRTPPLPCMPPCCHTCLCHARPHHTCPPATHPSPCHAYPPPVERQTPTDPQINIKYYRIL